MEHFKAVLPPTGLQKVLNVSVKINIMDNSYIPVLRKIFNFLDAGNVRAYQEA